MSAPRPPADLHRREPVLDLLPAGTSLHRFHAAAYEPMHFDRSDRGRFNAPDAGFGVLYVARDVDGAFAETFLREPGRTLLDPGLLRAKAYCRFETLDELRLIRLAGAGLAILGATAEVVHGGLPYHIPQAWSAALAEHPVAAAGIAYHARHDDEALCFALFERAADLIRIAERQGDLDADWFWRVALRYRVGLSPR